jgi:phosphoribosylanthranilate isomerase
MWVKICANTNLEDALAAAEFGADAVGFVFAPSKRLVTPEQVRAISNRMPDHVERVGVFGAGAVEEIASAAEDAGLTAIQMHGGLNPSFTRALRARLGLGISLIQTLHWTLGADQESAARLAAEFPQCDPGVRVLLDSKTGSASGGTGKTYPWEAAGDVLAAHEGVSVIVAGGLRPENVAEAIRTMRPWGVDVASGVEREAGKKDLEKLKAFIENARRA